MYEFTSDYDMQEILYFENSDDMQECMRRVKSENPEIEGCYEIQFDCCTVIVEEDAPFSLTSLIHEMERREMNSESLIHEEDMCQCFERVGI